MDAALIILKQIIIMFLLMMVGFILRRKNIIDSTGTKQMSDLMIYICNPAIMVNSFNIVFSYDKLKEIGITFVLSVIITIIGIVTAAIFMRKEQASEKFGIVFCNAGFIGIPLIQSVVGKEAIFYLTIYLVSFTLFVWTYGVLLISKGQTKMNFKKIVTNPALISVVLGLIIFISPIKLPEVIYSSFDLLGACNTPLGMIILGAYLANSTMGQIVKNKVGYKVSFYRLVIAPLATIAFLSLIPAEYNDIKLTLLIASSTPVGVMLAIFSQMFSGDYEYGARIVSLSTLLSLLSLPVILSIATILWQI